MSTRSLPTARDARSGLRHRWILVVAGMVFAGCMSGRVDEDAFDGLDDPTIDEDGEYVAPWEDTDALAEDDEVFAELEEVWPEEEDSGFWDDDVLPTEETPGGQAPLPGTDPLDPDPLAPGGGTTREPTEYSEGRADVPAYGTHYHWGEALDAGGWGRVDADLREMRRAGIEYVRLVFPVAAGDDGTLAAPTLDTLMERVARVGMHVLPVLIRVALREGLWQPAGVGAADAAIVEWERFAQWAAARYGVRAATETSACPGREAMGSFWRERCDLSARPVRIWEIWEGANDAAGWGGEPSARDYAELLRRARFAMHSVHRLNRLVLGGLSTAPSAVPPARFVQDVTEVPNGRWLFDAVAIHPRADYVSGTTRQVLALADRMMRIGLIGGTDGHVGIWVTGLGWALPIGESCDGQGLSSGRCARLATVRNHDWQAQRMRAAARDLRRHRCSWRLGVVFWSSFHDLGAPAAGPWEADVGLVNHDRGARASLGALSELARTYRSVRPPVLRDPATVRGE